MIARVVEAHGPVHLDAVGRVITAAHGWTRMSAHIEACSFGLIRTKEPNGTILWGGPVEEIVSWRGMAGRDPSEIPVAELAGLLRDRPDVLKDDDPVLALARQLGLSRLASSRRTMLAAVLSAAQGRFDGQAVTVPAESNKG